MNIFRKHIPVLLALALVLVLGVSFAGCGASEPAETEAPTEKPVNPAYTQVFTDRGIIHIDSPAFMNEQASFAMIMDEDGSEGVDVLTFYYEDDVISAMHESVYIGVEGLDQAGLDGMKEYMESTVQQINGTGLAEADWGEGPSFYRITVYMKDLDDMDHANALKDAGLLTIDNPGTGHLSMTASRDSLVASGYIEK